MKYETPDRFRTDLARLSASERARFHEVVRTSFSPACDAFAKNPQRPWPRALRVKRVQRAPGVLEMTWSFSGPDGRATFELLTVDGELVCRWRRVGGHEIFKNP